MIKKLLSSVLLIATVGVVNSFGQQANCTPNISCVPTDSTFGICPDSATGLPGATLNQAYSVSMSIKIPASTTSFGQTVALSHLALTDVQVDLGNGTYVPAANLGLTYLGSGANAPSGGVSGINSYTMTKYCYWDAPGTACVIVSGTPNAVGTFPIRIKSQGRANTGFGYIWAPAPDNNKYRLVVTGPTGIETLDNVKFEVEQNYPNPFSDKSEIHYSSATAANVEFKVYNMLGAIVYSNKYKSEKGANTITVDANTFSPGIYMYSIKNGDNTITKRMIVSNK
jgi:hypothetical protein